MSTGWIFLLNNFVLNYNTEEPSPCVGRDELKKRITDMGDFLKVQPTAITEYDDSLVRRLIEKVTVYEDKFTVEFKSGLTVNVDE